MYTSLTSLFEPGSRASVASQMTMADYQHRRLSQQMNSQQNGGRGGLLIGGWNAQSLSTAYGDSVYSLNVIPEEHELFAAHRRPAAHNFRLQHPPAQRNFYGSQQFVFMAGRGVLKLCCQYHV
jgi:hypothetical protein